MDKTPKIQTESISMDHLPAEYLMCIQKECPLCSRCLRYYAATRQSNNLHVLTVVNPSYHGVATEDCPWFRPNEIVTMKRGMIDFFHEMPGRMERSIRDQLIQLFGRTPYFNMRRGDRLITPSEQQQIARTCRQNGWQGELNYDGEVEDVEW